MDPFEGLASCAYQEEAITAVIRPAAVLPERAAREVLVELALRDVNGGGKWWSSPTADCPRADLKAPPKPFRQPIGPIC